MEIPHSNIPAPWYRQFWPWYLLGLLFLGVAGTSVLIVAAVGHQDPLVVDDYYKEGLAINRTLDRQHQAAVMGLEAAVHYDAASASLSIRLHANSAITADTLTLQFFHATLAHRDYRVILRRESANLYRARLKVLRAGNYDMTLEPDGEAWRLDAHLDLPAGSWSMKPEL